MFIDEWDSCSSAKETVPYPQSGPKQFLSVIKNNWYKPGLCKLNKVNLTLTARKDSQAK